jgi:hypothetical protein
MNTFIFLLAAGVGNPPAAPLTCAAPSAAKGDVKGGPPLLHTFELANSGASPISITKIEAGCGCVRRVLTRELLAPGETAKLTIEVNTLTQPDGPNRWQVSVAYQIEAAGKPRATGELLLQISATLSREVSVTPPQLAFSSAGAAAHTLQVGDTRGKPLTVVRAVASSPHLTAEVSAREMGKPQAIVVRLAADAPAGERDESILLQTDDPAYPELRVPVRVLKRAGAAVTAAPESITVRIAPGSADVSSLVQLRSRAGKALAIAAVESDHPAVSARWSPGEAAVAVVRITLSQTAAAKAGSATVKVKLAEPVGQELLIPVAWTVIVK